MAKSSQLSNKALDIWLAAYEACLCHGDVTRIAIIIEKALEDSGNSERERIADWLEIHYSYFPHIAKEVRELQGIL